MYGDQANKLVLDAKRFSNLPSIPMYQSDLVRDIVKETNDLNKDSEYLLNTMERLQNEEENGETSSQLVEDQKINQCQTFVTHLSMRRNKRCLLAYEKVRSDKLVEFSWLNVDPMDSVAVGNDMERLGTSTAGAAGPSGRPSGRPSGSDFRASTTTGTTAGTTNATSKNSMTLPPAKSIPNYTTQLDTNNLNHFEQDFFKNYQDLIMNYRLKFGEYLDLMGDLQPPTDIFIDVRCLKDGGDVTTEYGSFNLIKDSQFYVRKSDVERLIQQGYLEEI